MQRDIGELRDGLVDDAVLYLCGFVVSVAGVRAVTMMLQPAEMGTVFTLALAAGFLVSWHLRRYEALRAYGPAWTAALAGIALAWYWATDTFLGQPVALAVGPDRQLGMAVLLAGLVIVRSFGLLRVDDLLFCVVPSLAIFGLLGSQTFDPQFVLAFLAFAFASAYLAGQAHLMVQRRHSRAAPGQDPRRVARERLAMLAALFALSVGAAVPTARAAGALMPRHDFSLGMVGSGERSDVFGGRGDATGRAVWESPRWLPVGTGPVRLDARPVMHVKSAEPLYWRAGSLSHYTGNGWMVTTGSRLVAAPAGDGSFDLRPAVNAKRGRVLRQQFQFVGTATPVVFAAAQPVEVRPAGNAPAGWLIVIDEGGSLSVSPSRLGRDASYEVWSQVDHLAARGAPSVLDASDPELLRIPNSARQIRELAREAVGDTTAPQARIAAIVAYLQARADYSLDAPATPAAADAALYFLTRSRTGYCDLFATAAALMFRAVGIPARVAVGYAPGEWDAAADAYIVRGSDAHAWVEAYLPDEGWVTVDASPASAQDAATAAPRRGWLQKAARALRRYALYVLAALAALAWAALTAKARWLDDYLALRRRERSLRPGDYRGEVLLSYEKLTRALGKRGLPRRDWETPNEYVRRLSRAAYLASLMPKVRVVTGDYVAARFSEREMTREQAQAARRTVGEVAEGLRRLKNIR